MTSQSFVCEIMIREQFVDIFVVMCLGLLAMALYKLALSASHCLLDDIHRCILKEMEEHQIQCKPVQQMQGKMQRMNTQHMRRTEEQKTDHGGR